MSPPERSYLLYCFYSDIIHGKLISLSVKSLPTIDSIQNNYGNSVTFQHIGNNMMSIFKSTYASVVLTCHMDWISQIHTAPSLYFSVLCQSFKEN